jgi:nucleotide-binding universal stress UspA family protein
VGVDGTASGRDAVVLASLLGRTIGAELMLIDVVEESLVLLPGPDEVSSKTIREQARATLAKTRDSLAPEARIVVQTGALVWRALESVVRHQHRDLLVIGSGHHGKDGLVRLGQNAQELLCDLECPLAIAPRGMRNLHKPALERVGVGFDGEPEAQGALELAASIAGAAGAELEVLGVVDDRVSGGLRTEQIVLAGDAIVARQVDSLIERALIAVDAGDAPARVQVIPGNPSEALGSLAARVDLLVIGSSRSGPAGRLSLGRTGHAVAAGCPCPVMIVPRPRDASAT